ncbi:MAG: Spy/CpxP family protein refolding chaperone [Bacteroidales bacterium]|nr:Spy/CpxP family protein refolding chaperone [Bacteroidales bacterium]
MKTNNFYKSALLLSMVLAFGFGAMAQRGQGMQGQGMMNGQGMGQGQGMMQGGQCFYMGGQMPNCSYLNLTDEQQTKIQALRLELTEKNLPLKNELGEMSAKMKTLQTGNDQDMKAISKLIDDMSKVQAQIRKNVAEHRIEVRALLTDEQKVLFDAHQGRGMGKGVRGGNFRRGNRGPRAGMKSQMQ